MRISKTISILFFAAVVFVVTTVIAQDQFASRTPTDFLTNLRPTKGQKGLPQGLDESSFALDSSEGRDPASIRPTVVKKPTHWSAQANDGFEYKIHNKSQTSAVWVLKRGDHYDLIFASNAGSRVNLSLPAEQFYALKNAATDLRAPASDVNKCKDNFVQLEVMEEKTRKTLATCLSTKSAQAEQLRQFGQALTAYVR